MTLEKTPDIPEIEERCRALWDECGVYLFDPDDDRPVFSVDTPPPYVSAAHLHVGHAMSYAQAEFIIRYQRMRGMSVYYPMGFDDNGLPTERYVETAYNIDRSTITRSEFRKLCLEETTRGAEAYERLWRKLGLSVDWRLRYSTIDEHCRRTSQLSFIELHKSNRIYRSNEPVFWDTAMETSLAQADLETITRKGRLLDVAFSSPEGDQLVISTTRPELLPSCVALYFNPTDERYLHLAGGTAIVPVSGHEVPILSDEDVVKEFGTGLMMVCTFGDSMDVQRWRRDGLELRLGIDQAGRMTDVAGAYAGLTTEDARKRIIEDLKAGGYLLGEKLIEQQVFVSERSRQPVEFQMRPHWFVRVLDLKDELLARSDELVWRPPYVKVRLESWIKGLRFDWNITRQRFYGVPFPVWFCSECGEVILARAEDLPVDPLEDAPPVDRCHRCGGTRIEGDPDVMDTWMTSSLTPQINTNWAGSPDRPPALRDWPLTLRVQASEIIRTWLFYTLVKAHLHQHSLPWTHVMISGLGLNEQGRQLSKRDFLSSKPGQFNRYDPEQVVDRYGADALRYWAAGSHLGNDTRYNEKDVKVGRKLVLKLWNVARFVEQYMGDFDPATDSVPVAERTPEDRWLVHALESLLPLVEREFGAFEYARAREAIDHFFWNDFADDYIEIVKDRFWSPERHTDHSRDSARTTLWESLRTLLSLYAPLVPFITEELYQQLYRPQGGPDSLHAAGWPVLPAELTAPVPEMAVLKGLLDTVRAERTKARVSQSLPLEELVVDLADATDEVRAAVGLLETALLAVARTRAIRLGEASIESHIPGVRIDLVLGSHEAEPAGAEESD